MQRTGRPRHARRCRAQVMLASPDLVLFRLPAWIQRHPVVRHPSATYTNTAEITIQYRSGTAAVTFPSLGLPPGSGYRSGKEDFRLD
jgi:hypothetical protein